MLIDSAKISAFEVALKIGHSLKELAKLDSASTYDVLSSSVVDFNIDSDIDMDSIDSVLSNDIDSMYNEKDSMIIAYLDSIGVPETVICDLVSHRDSYSMDSLSTIAMSYDEKFDEEAIFDSAYDFAVNFEKDGYTFDAVKPKAGYKRQLVVRNGKKVWINKRVAGRAKLSPKQKMALVKARLKAHTSLAKQKRAKSSKARSTFGMK